MTDDREMDGVPGGGTHGAEEDLLGPELRALLSSLPKELPPERDISAEIAAQTWDSRRTPAPGFEVPSAAPDAESRHGWRTSWSSGQGWLLAAAAAILVVVSSTLTVLVMRSGDGGESDRMAATSEEAIPAAYGARFASAGFAEDLRIVAEEYEQAVEELRAVLDVNRDALGESTMQIVEENLEVLDAALRETVEALRSAPADAQLRESMVATYERKLDFLRQAVALTAES
jgi:hypothetical protein